MGLGFRLRGGAGRVKGPTTTLSVARLFYLID